MFAVHDSVKAVPGRSEEASKYDLFFHATDLPPMGFRTYLLVQSQAAISNPPTSGFSPDIRQGHLNIQG